MLLSYNIYAENLGQTLAGSLILASSHESQPVDSVGRVLLEDEHTLFIIGSACERKCVFLSF